MKLTETQAEYAYPKAADDFKTFCEYLGCAVVEQIVYLIKELAEVKLFFKCANFPVELFKWYEERPVFTYEIPLCEVIEFRDCKKGLEEYLERTIRYLEELVGPSESSDWNDSFELEDERKELILEENSEAESEWVVNIDEKIEIKLTVFSEILSLFNTSRKIIKENEIFKNLFNDSQTVSKEYHQNEALQNFKLFFDSSQRYLKKFKNKTFK